MIAKRLQWTASLLVATGLTLTFYSAPNSGATTRDSIVARVTTTNTSMSARGEVLGADIARPLTDDETAAVAGREAPERITAQVVAQSEQQSGSAIDPAQPSPGPPIKPPGLTYSFDTGESASTRIDIAGWPADANVATSNTHICVTARGAFACYTKGGELVNLGAAFDARPYTAREFFQMSGFTVDPIVSPTNSAKDGRVVFDRYYKRFFMVFQTREPHPRLFIAASKSEDPRDGWWTYADDVEDTEVNGQDYMRLGVNATHLLVSNRMLKCTGTYGDEDWVCKTNERTRHFMYTTADLASGQPYSRSEWMDGSAHVAVPAVHDTPTADAFWVSRDDDTHASVWRVHNGLVTSKKHTVIESSKAVKGAQDGGDLVDYDLIERAPQNCHYRGGRIVCVSNDGFTWPGQTSPNNAVRLLRINVSAWPTVIFEIDKIFGRAGAGDPSGAIYDYGWPAVAANANGDIVVGSVRSNSTIYPELRASVLYAGESDISPNILLRTSSSAPALICPDDTTLPCKSHFHMAGAAADPSTSGVYLAQQFGSTSPSWRIHVAKMLGSVLPDLIATQIEAPTGSIVAGASSNVTVTVVNQGDGPMPASWGELRLSTNNFISPSDTLLRTFSVPALAPNQVATLVVPFTIPSTQAAGNYYVGVMLDTENMRDPDCAFSCQTKEYSEANNSNPFQAGNRGNAPISVITIGLQKK
ncbi:MAG: hypothetical protein MOB07_00855 [Acidobacteria bacterium]|nr:hypothetical protein [Acidobacteriota bacterium]